jgi:hypothetical protein
MSSPALERAAPGAAIDAQWEALVGEEIAAHCRPVGMKGGVLFADVDSSVWCQQLQLRSPEILAALRRGLGDAAPTDLRLRVGYARAPLGTDAPNQEPPEAGEDSAVRTSLDPHRPGDPVRNESEE